MAYFLVTPEDAGHAEPSGDPTAPSFVFDTWLGDELVQAYPVLLATDELTRSFEALPEPTGFRSTPVTTRPSLFLLGARPRLRLPSFHALEIYGKAGVHPLGLTADRSLVVSQAALDLLVQHVVPHLQFSQFALRHEAGLGTSDSAGRETSAGKALV